MCGLPFAECVVYLLISFLGCELFSPLCHIVHYKFLNSILYLQYMHTTILRHRYVYLMTISAEIREPYEQSIEFSSILTIILEHRVPGWLQHI